MTLKFNITYRQVPCSSVGRASDRTMLRSVVRVQSLARGNLSFLYSFFFLFFFFFFFIFLIISFSFLITRLWRLFLLIHISFIIKSITFFCSKCQIEVVHQNKNYQCTEIGKVILNWNRKSKWTEFPLTNWIICKPLQRRFFSSYQRAHMFLGLIFAVQRTPKHDFKVQSYIPTSSPQLSG